MNAFELGTAQTHVLSAGEYAYKVHVLVPDGPPPPHGWPCLFLLDADGCFATAVEAMLRMARRPDATAVTPTVLVGISAVAGHDPMARQRDFTTPRGAPSQGHGGAEAFLRFLQSDVLPWTQAQAGTIDQDRLTLFGHSLAGYFALWTLLAPDTPFRRICAASPSLWWDSEALSAGLEKSLRNDAHVAILLGEWEGELPPWQNLSPDAEQVRTRRHERNMIGAARSLYTTLATILPDGHASFSLLPGEEHASIVSTAIPRALRLACRG